MFYVIVLISYTDESIYFSPKIDQSIFNVILCHSHIGL